MTNDEALRKIMSGDGFDFLREALARTLAEVMEVEIARLTGAGPNEKSPDRLASRNGYRERRFDTRLGSIELLIPKLRKGSYFPGASWNRASARSGRCWRSSRRPTSRASAPARWRTCC